MREIVFDTETTGLDPNEDRVIELGCVELDNRFPTGRSLHHFINAQGRSVHPEAQAVARPFMKPIGHLAAPGKDKKYADPRGISDEGKEAPQGGEKQGWNDSELGQYRDHANP